MTVAIYVRVSTEEQSLTRQLEAAHEFAAKRLGAHPNDDVVVYRDKSTGTNTDRSGYRDLMRDVDAGVHEAVVVHSVSRLARSLRDFDATVEQIVEENDTALHIISEGFDIEPGENDPYQRALLQLLGVFAELEAEMAQKRTREGIRTRMGEEDYHHGPAPLGFEKEDGHLIEAPNYDRVCAVLDMVASNELSKRKAAQKLGSSRPTINRALDDRPGLYGLKGSEEAESSV